MQPKLNPAALEQARGFLSSLFLGLRAAQTHEFSHRLVESATRIVLQSASQLYTTTGGFSIQFGESAALLNGQRLQLDGGADQALASLKSLLETSGMGGIEMKNPPTEAAMKKLILLFCPASAKKTNRDDIARAQRSPASNDLQAKALKSYAKLVLALRGEPLRVRRILQDLVDVVLERPNFILKLSSNDRGGTTTELHGVNTALVALVMGRSLGLSREDLVLLGSAALHRHVGAGPNHDGELVKLESNYSAAQIAATHPIGRNTYLRIAVIGERCGPMPTDANGAMAPAKLHLFSRITAVAVRYQQLIFGSTPEGKRFNALQAVERLANEESCWFDERIIDLAVNVLRIYPIGTGVILDSGEPAIISETGARWDRPTVRIDSIDGTTRIIDLAKEPELTIAGTRAFLGTGDRITLDELEPPVVYTDEQLREIGVAPISRPEWNDTSEPVTELRGDIQVTPGALESVPLLKEPLPLEGLEEVESQPPPLVSEPPTLENDVTSSEIGELKQRLERRRKREEERYSARRASRIEHLTAQISGYRTERDELAEEAASLAEDAVAAQRLAENVVVRQSEVSRALTEIGPAIGELETKLDTLWTRRQELGDQANDLEHAAMAARAEARDAEDKAAEADNEAKQREERIAELEAELEALRSERDDLERAGNTFRNAAAEEKRMASEAEAKAEEIRREAQEVVPELTSSEEKLDLMRERRHKLESEKAALEQSAVNAKAIAEEAGIRVEEARAKIAEADETLAELEKELAGLR
jgi:hypothetical protein